MKIVRLKKSFSVMLFCLLIVAMMTACGRGDSDTGAKSGSDLKVTTQKKDEGKGIERSGNTASVDDKSGKIDDSDGGKGASVEKWDVTEDGAVDKTSDVTEDGALDKTSDVTEDGALDKTSDGTSDRTENGKADAALDGNSGAGASGDVNGDGVVDSKDITILRRYIVGGWNAEILVENSDVNGDGTIDAKDVTKLRRTVVGGWDKGLDLSLIRGGK